MYYSGAPFAFKENKNVRSLLAYISKKGFSVGGKLPPERELAEQLGISRNSLREALKVLEAMDVLEIRHGSGIFLRKEDTQPDDGSSLWLMIHKDEILNILTVREALDLKAIDLIPEEDYPRLRDEMKACIAAVRKTDLTNEDMLRHDLEFHNIIRRAANNDILLNICITLTGTIYDERRVLFTHTNYVEQSLWEHNQIANAFGSLDVNQVKQAYIAHLATTRSSIELTQPETRPPCAAGFYTVSHPTNF